MRVFLTFNLLLAMIFIGAQVYTEESEAVEVVYIEGTVFFMEERNNVVFNLEPGAKLSYGDKLIILDNSSVLLRDKKGFEVEVAENTQAEIGEIFGVTTQGPVEYVYVIIAILAALIILLLCFLFFRKRGVVSHNSEKVTQNNNFDYKPENYSSNAEEIYEDDIELRFDENGREMIFEVIKGGVVPSYSTLRLDEKRVKCLLQKLNDMNEKWFEDNSAPTENGNTEKLRDTKKIFPSH